ncbi:MAG: glycosyltransferase [Bacteroidota bacterium]|nr:glycosyltransferase [Bacteroidota bacterium]
MQSKLAIIIVNYNVQYFLELCLQSVYKAITVCDVKFGPLSVEVWVVDNHSEDGSCDMIKKMYPSVLLIENKFNAGFSKANNQAIVLTKAEYILLLNPDTVIPENCLIEVLTFADEHPNAGGIGVKMLEGRGKYLPESKRGFPSPIAALYKITGINALFSKSGYFNKYYLGNLDQNDIQKIDVLAGAFVLARLESLAKIGNLDEDYFMYGEDIDLSYCLTKAGYQNYYLPSPEVIHYKGESTKKGSLNYVYIFYKAMAIFAKKHLRGSSGVAYQVLINIAIWSKASLSGLFKLIKLIFLPIIEFFLIYGLMYLFIKYWETTIKYVEGGKYPSELFSIFLPIYVLVWIISFALTRNYKSPFKLYHIVFGVLVGLVINSLVYAFLDESYRYSRAIIAAGSLISLVQAYCWRIAVNLTKFKIISGAEAKLKKIIIVADNFEFDRINALLSNVRNELQVIGFVANSDNSSINYLGKLSNIESIIKAYACSDLIFSAENLSYIEIILLIKRLNYLPIDFKIVPSGSDFIIGSNSKNEPGDYYLLEEKFELASPEVKKSKRSLDILFSLGILLLSPILTFISGPKIFQNIMSVMSKQKTWVSYHKSTSFDKLPQLLPGVLTTLNEVNRAIRSEEYAEKLNFLYAKHYSKSKDIRILLKSIRQLGK